MLVEWVHLGRLKVLWPGYTWLKNTPGRNLHSQQLFLLGKWGQTSSEQLRNGQGDTLPDEIISSSTSCCLQAIIPKISPFPTHASVRDCLQNRCREVLMDKEVANIFSGRLHRFLWTEEQGLASLMLSISLMSQQLKPQMAHIAQKYREQTL